MPLLALDLGNTTLSWALFDAAGAILPPGLQRIPHVDSETDFLAEVRKTFALRLEPETRALIASVRSALTDKIIQALEHTGVSNVISITQPDQVPIQNLTEKPEGVGVDRLLNGLAASSLCPGQGVLVADVGSAVTLDLIDEGGAFRGGSIAPGIRLCANALHDYAPALPRVLVKEAPTPLGRSTVGAIRSGVFHQVVGGIERLSRELSEGQTLPLILTGGDAALISSRLGVEHRVVDELTLLGVFACASKLRH